MKTIRERAPQKGDRNQQMHGAYSATTECQGVLPFEQPLTFRHSAKAEHVLTMQVVGQVRGAA